MSSFVIFNKLFDDVVRDNKVFVRNFRCVRNILMVE